MCPRLGGRYVSPEGPPEELLPGEKAECPAGPADFKSTMSLPQPSSQEAAAKTVIGNQEAMQKPHHLQGGAHAWSWSNGQRALRSLLDP